MEEIKKVVETLKNKNKYIGIDYSNGKDATCFVKVPSVGEWTVTELRKCCKKNKVKGYTRMDREQLIDAVNKVIENIKSR